MLPENEHIPSKKMAGSKSGPSPNIVHFRCDRATESMRKPAILLALAEFGTVSRNHGPHGEVVF